MTCPGPGMTRGWGNAELLVGVPESVTWNVGSGLDIVDLVLTFLYGGAVLK